MKSSLLSKMGVPLAVLAIGSAKHILAIVEENISASPHKCAPAAPVATSHPCPPVVPHQSEHLHQPQYSQGPHLSAPQHYSGNGDGHLQHAHIHQVPLSPQHHHILSQHLPTASAFDCPTFNVPLIGVECQEQPDKHC